MEIFERNIKSASEKKEYGVLVGEITSLGKKGKEENVSVENAEDGESIFAIEKEKISFPLNSRYNSREMARAWADALEPCGFEGGYFLFGFADGSYAREIRKKYPDAFILIHEPSKEIFDKVIHEKELSWLFEDEKIFLTLGEKGYIYFLIMINDMLSILNMEQYKVIVSPNYERIYKKEWLKFQIDYYSVRKNCIISMNTENVLQESRRENFLNNMVDYVKQYSVKKLILKFRDEVGPECPGILISGGPSLDKNITQLKQVKGKAIMVAVDVAAKTCVTAGVLPDFIVCIDPIKPMSLLEDERIRKIPMIMLPTTIWRVQEHHSGKRFYFSEGSEYYMKLADEYGDGEVALYSGGSVSTIAFSLLRGLGLKTIIMVGQDLAFSDGKLHPKDTFKEGEDLLAPYLEKKFLVPANDGGMIYTEPVMDSFRKWFETQALASTNLKIINATEGGAKITGTEVMDLKTAISKNCKQEKKWDIEKTINAIEPSFTEEAKRKIEAQLKAFPKELRKVKRKLGELQRNYENLQKDIRKKELGDIEIRELLTKVKKGQKWFEENDIISILTLYIIAQETILYQNVYQNIKDDAQEEVENIASQGAWMVKQYIEVIPRLQEDWEHKVLEHLNNY